VSYLGWLKLLLARNDKISDSGSSDVVGPYSAIWSPFDLPVTFTFIIPAALFIYFAKKLRTQNVREDLILLAALGTLVGPYSPAQDAILLTVVFISKLSDIMMNKTLQIHNKIFFVNAPMIILSCLTLSTRISFLNSLIILIVNLIIFKLAHIGVFQLLIFGTISLCFISISNVVNVDHFVYDIAGFGTLCMAIWLVILRFLQAR
jgi:hypothetical protein